jgi:hypothetical protein
MHQPGIRAISSSNRVSSPYFRNSLMTFPHLSLKDTQSRQLCMQNFIISPDGRILRWTCTTCQQDNFFVANSSLYPERVKWRCEGCKSTAVVYRPDKWIEQSMFEYIAIHREGQRAKWARTKKSSNETKVEDSVAWNHVDIGSALLAEGPDLPCGRHGVDEELDPVSADCTFYFHL